ncbi:pollen Ole e 1 allergen/extensin family protein, partial [Pasteurella multocida]|uniref:pollen Ole e 1 allergen/extensin family protein n=1 Tax=Pasteurella multocida TaxID=747 RepID=UPI001F0FA2AF
MAKSIFTLVSLILSAFCFSSVLGTTQNAEQFFVEGKIYCDPCRLEFETKLSQSLSGVKVSLECKKPDDDSLTFSSEGFTDNNGVYSIPVEGDHEDEVCMLKTVTSTHPECNELMSSTKSF